MNKFNRALRRHSNLRTMALTAFALVTFVVAMANMICGLAMLAVFAALLYIAMQGHAEKWSSNVSGENAYQILGVSQDADGATIRRAFRELERALHPDAMLDDRKAEATALFIRINQAHELLSDEEKRYEYDHLLEMGEGTIPPFDEAYRQIKDVDKHEMYAAFDELHSPAPTVPPEITAPPVPLPVPVDAEPRAPVEVELPDSVREALGLPPWSDPLTSGGSIDDRSG